MDIPIKRVLLIEDNEDDYLIVQDLLREINSQDFDLEWVETVEAAREALTLRKYDICLVDHRLAGQSGLTLIQAQILGDPPFILLTGNEDHEIDIAATKAGAMDYLLKGRINAPLLERSIRYAIERAKREAALETALRQSHLLATAIGNLTDGLVVTDAQKVDNPIIFTNPSFSTMTGYTFEEVRGINCRFLQGPRSDPQVVTEIREAIKEQRPFKGAIRNYRKDGTPFWNGLKITPVFDEQGQLGNFVGLLSDITERLQSEIALQESQTNLSKAQEITHLGSWEFDLSNSDDVNSNALRWSDETFRLMGYQPGQIEVTNENFFRAVHPEDRERVSAAMVGVLRGEGSYDIEHRIVWPDGTEHCIHAQANLVLDEESGLPWKMIGTGQDITERTQVEATLRQSESRFRTSITEAPVPIMIHREDGKVLHISKGWTEYSGYDLQDIPTIADWAHHAYRENSQEAHEYIKKLYRIEETRSEGEWTIMAKNGQKRVWDFITTPLGTFGDNLRVVINTAFDVTERKQAEAELHFQKALLEAQTEASLDGIMVVSAESEDRKILSYNQRLIQMWEIPSEVVDSGDDAAFRAVILNQVANPKKAMEVAEYIYEHPTIHTREEVSLLNGRVFDRYSAPIADTNGSYYGRIWFFRDVTDIKQATMALRKANDELELNVVERTAELTQTNANLRDEIAERERAVEAQQESYALLHAVTEGTTDCIFVKDLEGRYLMINTSGASRRRKSIAEILGKVDADLFSPETAKILAEADHRILAAGHIQTFEETTVDAGVTMTHLVTKAPLRNPRGEIIGIVGIARDITARKQQEESLRIAKEEADKANAAKSEFLSRMSHELRTPLNAILGFSQLLNRQNLTPVQHESIGYIRKGGQHLLSLVNEILDIARIEAGHIEISIEVIDLTKVATECCAMVRPLADERNIKLINNLEGADNVYVLADNQRLKQVVINLLSNAIKYNREGGKVVISVNYRSDQRTQLTVLDTGLGMSLQDVQKLFTPFERLNSADLHIEGTGLGLALSKHIVTAMNGKLGVESVVGQGSTFQVELPAAQAPIETISEFTRVKHHRVAHEVNSYLVLSVEDNLSNIKLLEAIMEIRPEFRLWSATQGNLGLDIARQHHPDVILLDLNLPGLSGSEVLRLLRESEETRDIPVIIISADATPKQIENLMGAGARAYLTKPIDVEKLFNLLDEVLELNDTPAKKLGEEMKE